MMGKIKTFVKIILFVKNWPTVIWRAWVSGGKVDAKFRSGFIFRVGKENWHEFMQHVDFFRYFPSGEIDGDMVAIDFGGRRLLFNLKNSRPIDLGEVFAMGSYDLYIKRINLAGKTVVDIGAAIGDTPVYFSLKGAERIIAIEPLPNSFEVLEANIKLNNLRDAVAINAGVGAMALGDISLDPVFPEFFGVYPELSGQFSKKIPVITLDSIVRNYNIKDGVLKIDCEGWEYGIFRNASREILRSFEYIVMEYHYGFEELEGILKRAGFEVEYTLPTLLYVAERNGEYKNFKVGMLFAKRISD